MTGAGRLGRKAQDTQTSETGEARPVRTVMNLCNTSAAAPGGKQAISKWGETGALVFWDCCCQQLTENILI